MDSWHPDGVLFKWCFTAILPATVLIFAALAIWGPLTKQTAVRWTVGTGIAAVIAYLYISWSWYEVHIWTVPTDAQIFVDGDRMGTGDFRTFFRRGGTAHVLRVIAPYHRSVERSFSDAVRESIALVREEQSLDCPEGTANCNSDLADACERRIDTITDCGSCNRRCSLAHATPTCGNGQCEIASCEGGWADRNRLAPDGCEVRERVRESASPERPVPARTTPPEISVNPAVLRQPACALPNAVARVIGGVCTIARCVGDYMDRDGYSNNGCEALRDVATEQQIASETARFNESHAVDPGDERTRSFVERQMRHIRTGSPSQVAEAIIRLMARLSVCRWTREYCQNAREAIARCNTDELQAVQDPQTSRLATCADYSNNVRERCQ